MRVGNPVRRRRRDRPRSSCTRGRKTGKLPPTRTAPKPDRVPQEASAASKLDVVVCSIGPVNAESGVYGPKKPSAQCVRTEVKAAALQELWKVARPGLEPGTPRFSVVCSTS